MTSTLTSTLSAADRCDRCGARAYIRARLSGGFDLLFCAHHGRTYLDKLRLLEDVQIDDQSHHLRGDAPATTGGAG